MTLERQVRTDAVMAHDAEATSGTWVRPTPGSAGPGIVRLVWQLDARHLPAPQATYGAVAAALRAGTDPVRSIGGVAESWGCSIDVQARLNSLEVEVTGDPHLVVGCLGEVREELQRSRVSTVAAGRGRDTASRLALIRDQDPVEHAVDALVGAHLTAGGSLQWPPGGSAADVAALDIDALVEATEALASREPDAILATWPDGCDARVDPASTPPTSAPWFAGTPAPQLVPQPLDRHLDRPGPQSALVWGAVTSVDEVATWWGLEVLLEHLTGGLSSPWNRYLREELGATYGVVSRVEVHPCDDERFLIPLITAAVRPESLAHAADWTRQALHTLRRTGLDAGATTSAARRLGDRRRLARLSARGTMQTLALAHTWGDPGLDAHRDAWLAARDGLEPATVDELLRRFTCVTVAAAPSDSSARGAR